MFRWRNYRPADPESVIWDVIVVGAGMGGSLLGWSLARRGLKVLFLERGPAADPFNRPPRMGRVRRILRPEAVESDLAAAGRWNRQVSLEKGGRRRRFYLPLGSGPGGSSAIYGATLERFRREDLQGVDPDTVDPRPLPNRWPVSYDALRPYYREVEALFGVRGTHDPTDPDDDAPLREPPPMSKRDQGFWAAFEAAGLEPHRMHMGVAYKPGCVECLGELCPRDCKADGASRALRPALVDHGAALLTDFAVERFAAAADGVESVTGVMDGAELTLRAKVFVLAAGALNTPLLLRNSRSETWPDGLGNHRDLVGRGLMFHMLQIFALWPKAAGSRVGPAKTISSRIMNVMDGIRIGGLQSYAPSAAPGQIADFLVSSIERRISLPGLVVKPAALAAALIGARLFRDAALFATLTEDFAYLENRVKPTPDEPSGFTIIYNGTADLRERGARMRRFLDERLRGHRMFWLTQDDHLNFGHPSGTCRMGESPSTSVVSPDNRVHGLRNLYVVDASFFPSSAATNPSLTIAANALRVADLIAAAAQEA